MFMSPVTSSNPSHDVIKVDDKSSNLSSHALAIPAFFRFTDVTELM